MYAMSQYIGYVKKEDAKDILRKQRIMGKVLAVALSIVFFIMQTMVGPRLMSLYAEFGHTLPWYANTVSRAVVFILGVLTLLLVQPQTEADIDQKLRQYKPGEMILMSKLQDTRYIYTSFSILLVSMLYIILSIVLPIYDITTKV